MKKDGACSLLTLNYLRSCTRPEVFKYIRKLHKIVRRQQRKLKKYKHKLKFLGTIKSPKKENEVSAVEKKESTKDKTFLQEITEAAESAQNNTDFVYEPTSGLYYDQRTGYYYNAEYGLYYDGSSGCYYRYNQDKNEFEFHSQVQAQSTNTNQQNANRPNNTEKMKNGNAKRKRKKRVKLNEHSPSRDKKENDIEDGEITSSSESDCYNDVTIISDSSSCDVQTKYEDVAKKYPPSLRIIVQETNLPRLKIGTLFMITFKGGSLGREGNHDVIIPDVNVSKFHLKFTYNEEESVYKCTDLGSRNGTVLNGKRMSNAKQESESLSLVHGSVLVLSQTKLLCHIHSGNSTCGHCEPGLIIDNQTIDKVTTLSHKAQLKVLQKRYGLENEKYVNNENKSDPQYSDRAAVRRGAVGSSNDYEKTEVASTETSIPSNNKGFEMLSKLGWTKGESLGKVSGLLEPINLVSNEGTTGLGCDKQSISIALTKKSQRKVYSLAKTRERFNQIRQTNVLYDSCESSSE